MATNFGSTAAIDAYYQGMKEPVNAQITQANNDYQAALDRLQRMKENDDAQLYRSYVRQQQEIPGLMRASGNNGGMVDSAIASLANQYNRARADRSLNYEADVAGQDLDYNNRIAALRGQLAQYEQQANADKANLAAQEAALRARMGRARQTSQPETKVPAYKTASNADFYNDYPERSGKLAAAADQAVIDNPNSAWNDRINAIRNKVTPDKLPTTTPNRGWVDSNEKLEKSGRGTANWNDIILNNRAIDPTLW